MLLKFLLLFTILIPTASFADEVDTLSEDVLEILSHVIGKNSEGKERLELDKMHLLYELTKTGENFDCMLMHAAYTQEKSEKLLRSVEHGNAKFDLFYPGVDLSKFEAEFIQLKKGQTRVLILKGELDGEPVYFRLEIDENKKASVSYVKIPNEQAEEKTNKAIPIYEEDTSSELKKVGYSGNKKLIGVKGVKDLSESGSKIDWSVKKDSAEAKLTIQADGKPDQITVGLKINLEEQQEISGGIVKQVGAIKTSATGKLNQDGVSQGDIKVESDLGPLGVEVKSTVKTDAVPVHSGKLSLKKDDSEISAEATLNDDKTTTAVKAKTKIGEFDLSGEHSTVIETGEFQVKAGIGKDITKQQRIETAIVVDEKSQETIGVDYTYTNKDNKIKFKAAAKAIIVEEGETTIETSVSVEKKSQDGRDTITLSVKPVVSSGGSVETISAESSWDRKVSSNANIGIYAKTTVSSKEDVDPVHDIGIKAKVEFGGADKNIKILSVYKLHEVKIEEKNGEKYKAAYYLIWKYRCDLKKKKLKIEKPRKKLFGGYDVNHLPMSAMPLDAIPEAEYTLPKGVDKNTFCK